MVFSGSLTSFPRDIKLLIGIFLFVLSTGFISALQFVNVTTEASPRGIQENYLGNEEDLEAEEMKFAKNEKQLLSILHTHILSMAVIFFILSLLVASTNLSGGLKKFLMVEPLLSVLFTFGGIYLLWKGVLWMRFVVMASGALMTFSFMVSVVLIYWELLKKSVSKNS
ncbi:MAG: hypothetical protein V7724_14630 [Sediminicola sp.]|tara:strand:+ start:92393 stop:92896 length:504 start_codon:yes stop_codon:yes gene_type:complete